MLTIWIIAILFVINIYVGVKNDTKGKVDINFIIFIASIVLGVYYLFTFLDNDKLILFKIYYCLGIVLGLILAFILFLGGIITGVGEIAYNQISIINKKLKEKSKADNVKKVEKKEEVKASYDYEKITEGFSVYNKNIFGYGNKYGLPYFYFTKYYPVRYGNLNQKFVFDFKEGKNTEYYAEIFSTLINKIFKNSTRDITIIPVAASTIFKNEIRYKRLFELISQKTGVINGYDVIEVINNREAKHISNEYTSLDSHIKIHFEKLNSSRKIILIDDVITRGKTIREIAEKFIDKRNDSFVIGIVLAETYSNENYNFYKNENKLRIGMNKINILDFEEVTNSIF